MKITSNTNINNKNITFSGLYNNKYLLKGLKFASKNGALFSATTALALSTIARPIAIIATPKTDKENKKHACAKSIASTLVGYLIMLVASTPVAKAVENIDKNPKKYLTETTIKNLQNGSKNITASKHYMLATQLFKLGLGLVIALPKSAMTSSLIPPIMKFFAPPKTSPTPQREKQKVKSGIISFKGLYGNTVESISKAFGWVLNKTPVQNFAKKFSDTNFAQHIMSLTDIILTASFVEQVKRNKKIEEKRKKPLIHNSVIATGLCITGGYALNRILKKPTEKFIENFKTINKDLPELEKYIEGIKIAKPALILGGIYYIFIPLISTFLADRTEKSIN